MAHSIAKTDNAPCVGSIGTGTLSGYQASGKLRQKVWMLWERAMARLMAMTSDYTLEAGMCKLLVKKHKGAAFVCEDGTRIEKGDRVGELHLNNRLVLELTGEHGADRAALRTARLVRSSLRELGEALERRPELGNVKALVGVTLLHRGLTHGLGFEQRPLPSKLFERATAAYLKLLLRFLHPEGLNRSGRSREKLTPVMLVCTRANLLAKFPKREEAHELQGTSDRFFIKSSDCSPADPYISAL
ncbi:YkoP family protein [Cohnella phaseoli]|nr:polysaccharide deacetylase [Cohnella phaseoli]